MPELPEIETVKRVLSPQLQSRRITKVEILKPVIAHPDESAFRREATGDVFGTISRRGKFLILNMKSGNRVAVHLRMTGQLLVAPLEYPEIAHTHVKFGLDDGNFLIFADARRFGRIWLIRKGETDEFTGMAKLGPEPFDEGFTAKYFSERVSGRRITIKQALMEQETVAGIGNIYSDEICFEAGLRPDRPVSSLSPEDWEKTVSSAVKVLKQAVAANAVTAEEYLQSKGENYRVSEFFKVYGRENEACGCGGTVKRIKIAGRSSYFCPDCQK